MNLVHFPASKKHAKSPILGSLTDLLKDPEISDGFAEIAGAAQVLGRNPRELVREMLQEYLYCIIDVELNSVATMMRGRDR